MAKVYAGIGSRSTPTDVLKLMTTFARELALDGWLLRSGNAQGADLAFQAGAAERAEVYVPWSTFGPPFASGAVGLLPTGDAFTLAAEHHPAWPRLSDPARKLHARNCHQVLGLGLDEPARFIVCWTPNGTVTGLDPGSGGTGQALRVAVAHGVAVFNLRRSAHRERIESWVHGRIVHDERSPALL
jgi:hypothetical protein